MDKKDTLTHLLKAKDLALKGASKHLDQQFEEGQYDKKVKAKIPKTLAEQCKFFTNKNLKNEISLTQLNEIICELQNAVDLRESGNLLDAVRGSHLTLRTPEI